MLSSTRSEPQGFPNRPDTDLRAALERRIAAQPGAEVALWFEDLASGRTLGIADTLTFHAASTMKVPVMFELFRRADEGTLDLDDRIPLVGRFASIVDGSSYALDPADDSDDALYDRIGAPISYRELNERMIVRSSNLATNVLIERLDPTRVTALARSLGGEGVVVRRGVEDGVAFRAGLNNVTTARGLGKLLAALERGEVASPWATQAMRGALLRQEFNEEIPAGLPPGTPVAHKTGWITATTHDAAIVYPPDRPPFVLVILTRAIPERADAQRLMADLARIVWESYPPINPPRAP
ncbi:MAG: class A beta-lactamase-related serine hydrolase [Gemmatimonadetes bacterium]|nr:class A beta-lactamase-related serine hydrolase [Gemmatimonadota bacterium]